MIGAIADDLTGAAELGAVGLRYGLRAEIVRSGRPGGEADLVCVDTDSRSCAPVEAAKRAAAAAKILREAGATWIYKKVDSVLRGNVTPEVEAVMKQLKINRALLLPANPSLGRVIRDGRYFVKDKPIHRTEFAHDPQHPRKTSEVLRLVAAPKHFLLRLANGELTVPEETLLVGQTDSSAQVRAWAGLRDTAFLPVGGSEFFGALLNERVCPPAVQTLPKFEDDFAQGRQLFVCGTSSRAGRQLISSTRKARRPLFTLPNQLIWEKMFSPGACEAIAQRIEQAFARDSRVVLAVGLPMVSNVSVALRLSENLVDVAEAVLRRVEVRSIFAEGGATSAALVRRMNWTRLEVRREWAPGVATLAVAGENSRWLTIKPGSYLWPDSWTK